MEKNKFFLLQKFCNLKTQIVFYCFTVKKKEAGSFQNGKVEFIIKTESVESYVAKN